MLTWSFRCTGLMNILPKLISPISFYFLKWLLKTVKLYTWLVFAAHTVFLLDNMGGTDQWPPKISRSFSGTCDCQPHMAKGTLQMWLRIWTIILDYMQLQRSSKEAEGDMTTKEKEFSYGNRDQSYSCGQLPELEETKILSWALQKPCSYLDFSSVRL